MTANTLVLDLDGTLADTKRDLVPALNRTIATQGLDPVDMEDVGHIVGHGARAMIAKSFELRGRELNGDMDDHLYDIFLADYAANIANETVLFDGVVEALDRFSRDGWKLAVCTNKHEFHAVKLIENLGILDYFAVVTGGNTFSYKKPDPRHLIETVVQAGGSVETSVMVGDSGTDINTAKAATIPVVAVDFGYCDRPINEYSPDRLISHYNDLFDAASQLVG